MGNETTQDVGVLYAFVNLQYPSGDLVVNVIDADGEVLAEHLSSATGWARLDLGLVEGRGFWTHRHERYAAKYPNGYRIIDLLDEDPTQNAGFLAALERNRERAKLSTPTEERKEA